MDIMSTIRHALLGYSDDEIEKLATKKLLHLDWKTVSLDQVKDLIRLGADVNARNNHGDTALMRACQGGHADTVKMLIEHGADVNAKDKEGKTSLQWARINGHTDLAQFLEKAEKLCQQEVDEERKPRSPALHHTLAHGEQQGLNASLTEEYTRGNDISISITNRTLRNGR